MKLSDGWLKQRPMIFQRLCGMRVEECQAITQKVAAFWRKG